jgi:hypothetical protein
MAGPRMVAHLDSQTIVVSAYDGDGQPWLFVGGLERLPSDRWGCACRFCAGTPEQIPYESVFHPLAFTDSHRAAAPRRSP